MTTNRTESHQLDIKAEAHQQYVEDIDHKGDVSEETVKSRHMVEASECYSPEDAAFLATFDEARQRKVYRKVDWRLVPMLALLYLFAYIDRANIGNAKIEGMTTDLKMNGLDYNICVSVFFIPYIILEVPSNAILQRYFKTKPSYWPGGLCIAWGVVMTLHGAVKSYPGLLAARIALGIPEAGFFPGAILIVSNWYLRHMLQTRVCLFYLSSAVSGAVSVSWPLALQRWMGWQVSKDGDGFSTWAQGAVTVLLGLTVPFVLLNTVQECKWLDADEKRYLLLVQGGQDSAGGGSRESSGAVRGKVVKSVFTDWILYVQALNYWSQTIPNYGMKFFLPTILRGMGFTASNAQLMSIPPYVVGAIAAFASSLLADKYRRRYPVVVAGQTIILISFAILIPLAPKILNNVGPCYFAVCLANVGFYPIIPAVNAWTANNLAGHAKRAMGTAFMLGAGNIGGVFGSYLYLESEAPNYPTGYGTSMAVAAMGVCASSGLEFALSRINKRRARMTEEEVREKYTQEELIDLGDRSPLYRYML